MHIRVVIGRLLFFRTLLYPLFRLSLYKIASSSPELLPSVSPFAGRTALYAPASPSHSVLSLRRQPLFSMFSVFCMPFSFLRLLRLSWFRPSPSRATMASADFCTFSAAFFYRRDYVFRRVPRRPPRVPHVSFPPSTCHIYLLQFRVAIGLRLVWQSSPCRRPFMWFLFVRPEVCPWLVCSHIRLPSDSTSRWTPLPSAFSFPLPGAFGSFTL